MKEIWIEHIESYLEGRLTFEQLEQKAQALEVLSIQEDIDFVENSRIAIEAVGVRKQLAQLYDEEPPTSGESKFPKLYLILLALLVASILGYFLFGQTKPAKKPIYAFVDPGLPVVMGESDQYDLDDAMTYYKEGNYKVALEKFEQLASLEPQNDTLNYFIGVSQLYLGQANNAIPKLQMISEEAQSIFRERAAYSLVLAYLELDDKESAAKYLQPILDSQSHSFYQKSIVLKKQRLD